MNILVLSPHRDDAVFSLCLSIDHWLAIGHRVTLVNVFTRSRYAPFADAAVLQSSDPLASISAIRRQEDEAVLKCLHGLAMIDLELDDAPIRLDCDNSTVCDLRVDSNDSAITAIKSTLSASIDSDAACTALVLPLAVGHHVDHLTVRDAGLAFTATLPTAFYEDLPYANRCGAQIELDCFRQQAVSDLHEPLHPVLIRGLHTHPAAFKLQMTALYASQVDRELAETIANFSHRYHGGERLWVNDLWLKLNPQSNLGTCLAEEDAARLP